ncbi:hypothetical protein [Prevotella sp.]|uniref:hypothetical protein n=1 Tax=Prevotella sp. TaxID=59823 RepID=UPI00307A188E
MDSTLNMMSSQFLISLIVSFVMAVGFILWQKRVYNENKRAIARLKRFFSKKEAFSTCESYEYDEDGNPISEYIKIKEVADKEAELMNLIDDINAYIKKSKGTVAFSIIQNKTERRISMLYEIATSKLSFPTHIGLMGTFAGVFIGLIMFLIGTMAVGGITDSSIQSLITGVLVSMATSCCGIWLLILSHRLASEATNQIDHDKNDFYEWVQNELMPTVDVSMVEAIGKLHETIDKFEPTFSGVISQFKGAFKDVTNAFGTEFRKSVQVVASAVDTMGKNMDKVNKNIDLQSNLLDTLKSNQLVRGMDSFVEASKRFTDITGSLDQFERARRIMLVAAQETINIQKDFNESLQIPKQVAAEINIILNRITKFEESINGLGVNVAQTQMVGNQLVEQIKENINAIKAKQTVAEKYADTANKRLEVYFDEQKKEVSRIMQKYNEALESYLDDYETMLKERKTELESRNREFVEAIDRKLSIEDIRSDFKALREIPHQLEMLMRNPVDGGNERMNAQNEAADANRRAGEAESKSKFRKVEEEQRPIIDGEKRTGQFQNEKDKILAQIKQEEEKDKMVMEIINEARNSSSQNIISERTTTDSVQEKENVEEPKKKKWFKRLFKR